MVQELHDLRLEDFESFTADVHACLQPFLSREFDPQLYSRQVLQQSTLPLAEHLSAIDTSIAALDATLKNRVVQDHEQLTNNIATIETLETSLRDIEKSVGALIDAAGGSLDRFREFCSEYSRKLNEFAMAKSTADLLRKSTKIIQGAKKIRGCFADDRKEYLKASNVFQELGTIFYDKDLAGLGFIATDVMYLKTMATELPTMVSTDLKVAVMKQDLASVGSAVDAVLVFGNIGECVRKVTTDFLATLETQIQDGLNIHLMTQSDAIKNANKLPGRSTLPSAQSSPALRTTFWARVDSIFDAIHQSQIRVELLESVCLRSHGEFALYCVDAVEIEEGKISEDFFSQAVMLLKHGLEACGKDSQFLQQTLENEYPRLLKMLKEATNRLKNVSLFLSFTSADFASQGLNHAEVFRTCISSFQELFISRSLSRLLDPVNLTFSDANTPPTLEDVKNVVKTITHEITVCSADQTLGILVCKNVAKILRLMFVKLEGMVATDGEATQVIGPLTAKQIKNFNIIRVTTKIQGEIRQLLETSAVSFPEDGRMAIEDVLMAYEGPIQIAIGPLFNSLIDSVDDILLTMHQEDFSAGAEEADTEIIDKLEAPCSLYMRELQDFLSRIQQTFFTQLDISKSFIRTFVAKFASRCLELFIRHTCLIRPVGKHGRLKLATDFAQLEAAIAPLNLHISECGAALEVLKALRPMLFQTPSQVAESRLLGSVVPYSVILHHLFSRAPPDLPSPYQVSGWSISRYSRYLDEHESEKDRLLIVRASLDSYAQTVRNRGETHYAVIYPLMRELLSKGFELVT